MDKDEALRRLAQVAAEYKRVDANLDRVRDRTIEAIVTALRSGARPTDVDKVSPFTPTYNRRKARDAGVEPGRPGGSS